jgi:hypothetical protein
MMDQDAITNTALCEDCHAWMTYKIGNLACIFCQSSRLLVSCPKCGLVFTQHEGNRCRSCGKRLF